MENTTNHESESLRHAGVYRMTLLEILLATFILALGLVGVMSLVPVAIRQAGRATQSTVAASVAQNAKASVKALTLYYNGSSHNVAGDQGYLDWVGDERSGTFEIPEGLEDSDLANDEFAEEDRPFAWKAELEHAGEHYYHVDLRMFYPPPYRREVYKTTFMMRIPKD